MSLLMGEDDLIEIKINYLVTRNKYKAKIVRAFTDEEVAELKPEEQAKMKALNVKMKPQTYYVQNQLFERSMAYNAAKDTNEVNWRLFRESRLRMCLVEWDLTDDNGRLYPLNDKTINELPAAIGNALNNVYDEALSPDEGEMEKP